MIKLTTTQSLFDLSEQHGYLCLEPLKDSPISSLALILPSGITAWTVNPEGLDEKQYRDHISHEVGHAETGSFYTRYSAPTTREKCEETTRRWQYRQMLPIDELEAAFRKGINTVWELSEEFCMPEDFIRRAVEYYKMKLETWRSLR